MSTIPNLETMPKTTVSRLSNGMRVASEPCAGNTVTVGVWVDTGSRYETEENNGVAHFLEHMFFKGTKNRTQTALEKEIENMGGHLNAYTSREQTVFFARVFKEDTGKAMDILADILQNSNFDQNLIDREKSTILREMQEVESQIEEVVFDNLHATAYRGCSLGRTILGPAENINKMDQAMIKDYVDTHYTAPRMAVIGAGAIDHNELVKLADTHFGNVPTEGKKPAVFEKAIYTGSEIRERYDDMPEAHIAYALPIGGWTDPDTFPFLVMQNMIGMWAETMPGGQYSRVPLIAKSAKLRMAKKIHAFCTQYSDTGLFGVYAVGEPQALDDLMYNVQGAVTDFAYDVDETLLEQAKKAMIIQYLGVADGSTQVCEEVGRQILSYGRRIHPVETVARIQAVDAAAIKAAASKFLYDQCHALASIGPTHEMKDYVQMRRGTYRLDC
uniref:Mitochondrial-processing peptidase subunit beta n=1 Tax=Lotharella globosa TaxID=91324 RepID=A0A7S3Z8A2_9EUKA